MFKSSLDRISYSKISPNHIFSTDFTMRLVNNYWSFRTEERMKADARVHPIIIFTCCTIVKVFMRHNIKMVQLNQISTFLLLSLCRYFCSGPIFAGAGLMMFSIKHAVCCCMYLNSRVQITPARDSLSAAPKWSNQSSVCGLYHPPRSQCFGTDMVYLQIQSALNQISTFLLIKHSNVYTYRTVLTLATYNTDLFAFKYILTVNSLVTMVIHACSFQQRCKSL